MYLLDTNVISELRKAKTAKADPKVVAWANHVGPAELFLSVISILEFANSILPVDTTVALCCAKLHVPNPRPDRDALIAATALVHDLTVVTRNINDFEPMGVKLVNPWDKPT